MRTIKQTSITLHIPLTALRASQLADAYEDRNRIPAHVVSNGQVEYDSATDRNLVVFVNGQRRTLA